MKISKLATSQFITEKHWEERSESLIRFIIPHHMAARSTGANCAYYFVNNGLQNSANYCIGYDGDISCNVPEEFGPWTSSFWGADKYAITFEVSDTAYGDWRIPEAAQEAMINLMVDLFQRYPALGGKAIFDPNDEDIVVACKRANVPITGTKGNILLHMWTSAYGTGCPGDGMISVLPKICEEVNRRLSGSGGGTIRTLREEAQYMIDNNINGQARKNQAKADGFNPEDVQAEIDLMLGKNITACIAEIPIIEEDCEGEFVEYLQSELKRMGYYYGDIDRYAGRMTVTAIKNLQSNWNKVYGGLDIDGCFGQKCWKRLLTGK